MMTDYMQLNSLTDARTWAQNMNGGDMNDTDEEKLAQWIWENKPEIGVSYKDHPICNLEHAEFYEIFE